MTTDEIHSNADSHAHTESNANAENISNAENVAVSGESLKAAAAPKPSFTCIGRGHGAPVLPADREAWESLRREPWLAEMCRRIEEGDEALKRRLPVWTPHCAAFRDNHRAIADALQPLQRLMLDFDEKGHSAEILERALRLQDEGRWEVLLVEESVRRGTHVLITLPREMTAEVAQARFSTDVGFSADSVVKDVSRPQPKFRLPAAPRRIYRTITTAFLMPCWSMRWPNSWAECRCMAAATRSSFPWPAICAMCATTIRRG